MSNRPSLRVFCGGLVRASALALVVTLGCVSGADSGRTTDTGPASAETSSEAGESEAGTIFPNDDATADETSAGDTSAADTTATAADTATTDTKTSDTATCGATGGACCPGATCANGYCLLGACHAMPTSVEEGSDPGRCSDLGVTHVKPAFFARFTVTGRVNAVAHRMYKKVSCAGATPSEAIGSPFNLGATGTYSAALENTATTDCANANLGRYEVWFVVDGQETTHQLTAVFNSTCVTYATCASVANACP